MVHGSVCLDLCQHICLASRESVEEVGLVPAFHCFHAYCHERGLGVVHNLFEPEAVVVPCAWTFDGGRERDRAGRAMLNSFEWLSSPQAAFEQDCCEGGPSYSVSAKIIQLAWRSWCEENVHEAGPSEPVRSTCRQ